MPPDFADRWAPLAAAAASPTTDPDEAHRRAEALWEHFTEIEDTP